MGWFACLSLVVACGNYLLKKDLNSPLWILPYALETTSITMLVAAG